MWLYFMDRKEQQTFINNTVYPTSEHATVAALQVGRALDREGHVYPLENPSDKHRSTFLLFESPRVMIYLMRLVNVSPYRI